LSVPIPVSRLSVFQKVQYYRAIAYLQDSSFDRAIADLTEAVALDPRLDVQSRPLFADAYRGQGNMQLAAKHWDDAIISLGKAIRIQPKWAKRLGPQLAEAYRWRGFDHANYQEFDEAVRDFNEAVRLEPVNARNYRIRGLTYCKMAQWESAAADLSEAIKIDPDLEHELQRPLAKAQRNRVASSMPKDLGG
jgi:tetratricopeptide (TPR) repeat protein